MNSMQKVVSMIAIVLVASLISCSSNEIGNSKDVNPETIYLWYMVSHENGDDSVSCFLQYRFAGENGTTLVLNEPAGVSIDGISIPVDSSSVSGAFYKKNFAAEAFAGKHVINYTDNNGKVHEESFRFDPVTCTTALPGKVSRGNLRFEFAGNLTSDDAVITISDTSVLTEDVHVAHSLADGTITIKKEQLQPLVNGPLKIEISKTVEQPFKNPTAEGGIFAIMYGIKALETELVD